MFALRNDADPAAHVLPEGSDPCVQPKGTVIEFVLSVMNASGDPLVAGVNLA